MQNRYVGDIGDYVKLGLLRALSVGGKVGVAWWLYPDEQHNRDGRHIGYLSKPEEWRDLDPPLYDELSRIIRADQRQVSALHSLLPDAVFSAEVFPHADTPKRQMEARRAWVDAAKSVLRPADFIFADPDNGLETSQFSGGKRKSGKSISYQELLEFREGGRPLLVYHHQTRRKGGHLAEIEYLTEKMKEAGFNRVDAIRAHAYSARVFFLIDAPRVMTDAAEAFATKWGRAVTWYPEGRCK